MTAGPFYIEIYGEAGYGKTHQSHGGSLDPVHFDTASTSMSAGDYDIEEDEDRTGESWDVIHAKVHDWNEEEASRRYRYITGYEQALEELADLEGFSTVILDNWYDFRTLIVDHMNDEYSGLMQDRGWPTQNGWGKANALYREFVDAVLETGRHLVVISEMKDEYNERGNKTGGRERAGPSRAQFDCDFRIQLVEEESEGKKRRRAIIRKNRWLDRYSSEWVEVLGDQYDFGLLMTMSGIPDDQWK